MMTGFADGRHTGAAVEEWLFAAWTRDASLGVVSGHRIVGRIAWYWAALARAGRPFLHVLDDGIPVRADPFIVKGEALWAEHSRDAPMEQWSIGNETFAAALDDPDEALGRAYGDRTPIAFDIEWSATARPVGLSGTAEVSDVPDAAGVSGYSQEGVAHGAIEVLGEPSIELDGLPARRWHRWVGSASDTRSMGPVVMPAAAVDSAVRAPFAFPDGSVADLVLSPDGWRRRTVRPG